MTAVDDDDRRRRRDSGLSSFGTLPERVTPGSPPVATVTITDEDERGVTVSPTKLTIAEGESGSYTVVLTSEPTEPVTVTVGGAAGTHLTVAPASSRLTFTAQNWRVPQMVTVTAAADADAVVPPEVDLTHTVSGGDYAGGAGGVGDRADHGGDGPRADVESVGGERVGERRGATARR